MVSMPRTGNRRLDDEHGEMLLMLAQLEEMQSDYFELMVTLTDYVNHHTYHEEKFMRAANYEHTEEHILDHGRVQIAVRDKITQLQIQRDQDKRIELARELKTILVDHVRNHDVKMAKAIGSRRIE